MTGPARLGGNYWKLLGASVLGNLGDGVAVVALPWYASTLTHDPLAIAAVGVAGRLPWLLVTLLAGVVGDRVDRRRLMVTAAGGKALVLAGFALLVALEVAEVGIVLLVALAVGVCEVFFDNTGQTMIPSVVVANQLERANGTMWGAELVTNQFLGPPLGGFLIAVSLALPFAGQAMTAVAAVLLLATLRGTFRPVPADAEHPAVRPPIRTMLAEGLRWLWRHRLLRTLAIVLGLINAVMSGYLAVLVLFARELLGLSSQGFGLLLTAGAVGGLAGSQLAPWLARRIPPGATITGVLAMEALVCLLNALFPVVPVFVTGSILMSFLVVWWNVITVSLRQRIIPDALLSRVNSAYRMLGWGMMPLGALAGGGLVTLTEGWLGRGWALRTPFLLGAAVCAVLVVVAVRELNTRAIHAAEAAAQAPAR